MKRAAGPLLSLAMILLTAPAEAALFRAYVSSAGSDANPCTLAAPCRLLPAALAAVVSGGEIWMLDSANYNITTVDIVSKDVTILAIPGQVGSVVALGGTNAITTSGAIKLRLRNIVVSNNALSPGNDGVIVNPGGDLVVEGCTFAVPGKGIVSFSARVSVSSSTFRDGRDGIYATGGSTIDVWNSRFSGFGFAGIEAIANVVDAPLHVSVSDSSFTGSDVGVVVDSKGTGMVARGSVVRSSFSNSSYGAAAQVLGQAGGQAVMSIANNMFSNMTSSSILSINGAVVETLSNNTARNNISNGTAVAVSSF